MRSSYPSLVLSILLVLDVMIGMNGFLVLM